LLASKDRFNCPAIECLEATLRVAITEAQDNSQPEVKQPALKLAVQGLALRLQFPFQPT
jgi:hypothetical protein